MVWDEPVSGATPQTVHRGEPSSSSSTAITNFASSSTISNQQYYGSSDYQYDNQEQEYDAVNGLTQEFAGTTLTEQDQTQGQVEYSYEGDRNAQQTTGYTGAGSSSQQVAKLVLTR